MIFKGLVVGPFLTNCYILGDEKTKEGLVIDPGGEGGRVIEEIQDLGLKIRYIVNTHGHADHIQANRQIQEAAGSQIAIGELDAPMLASKFKNLGIFFNYPIPKSSVEILLKEGGKIEVGSLKFKVLETPGHTQGGICLYEEDKGVLFSGDTLFAGSVGRTDLPGGNLKNLLKGIKDKLLILPGKTKVFPGHGPETTIEKEIKQNPFL